jgi:translation initiation factor 1
MNRVVYSTDSGRQCPDCKHPKNKCICKQKKQQRAAPSDGIVRLQLQTKGRKGKGVTLITGLPLSQTELKQLAKDLKQRCSTGGSIKDDIIEIYCQNFWRLTNSGRHSSFKTVLDTTKTVEKSVYGQCNYH